MAVDPHEAELAARLSADEQRLAEDEQRLQADERRLLADEARLEATEEEAESERRVTLVVAGITLAVLIAVVALVLSVLALRSDVDVLGRRAPDGSVDTAALRDQSVTADKLSTGAVTAEALAPGAVGGPALARGAVGTAALAPNSVASAQVPGNALTGADIRESSLKSVPAADDAARLAGRSGRAYVALPTTVQATSVTNGQRIKGPITAACPAGTRVLSGGAAIEGAANGAALIDNTAAGSTGWTATGRVERSPQPSWRLVVTAICAQGGASP